MASEKGEWWEIKDLKVTCPRVLCIVPAVAQDIVASTLVAIGARPVFPEDPEDVSFNLATSMAILLDTGARLELIDALCKSFGVDSCPLIVSASKVGSSPKRSSIASKVVKNLEPTVICGMVADIVALSKGVCADPINGSPSSKYMELKRESPPKENSSLATSLPLPGRYRSRSASPARLKDKHEQRQVCRSPTPKLSHFQCREGSKINMSSIEATGYVRRLAARSNAIVYTHEMALISNGEMEVEVDNVTIGMENLHSMVEVGSGIISAVVAVVAQVGRSVTPSEVAHAVSLFLSAAEEAAGKMPKGVYPGGLRVTFVDTLFKMNEPSLREVAKLTQRQT